MSPFFLRQYVKGHASDVFEAYLQLLTEMVLRLPYQVIVRVHPALIKHCTLFALHRTTWWKHNVLFLKTARQDASDAL